MYSIRPYQAYSFRCLVLQQLRSSLLLRIPSQDLFGRSWHFLLISPISIIYLLFFCFGGIVMLLSSTLLLVLSGSCSFHAYPFNRSVVSSFQVSSHLVKIMFSSFHFQSKCCPNYISLIPSLSCLTECCVYHSSSNRTLIQVLSFCQVHILYLPFPTGVLPYLILIIPCTSRVDRGACIYFLSIVTFSYIFQPISFS